jgi:tetratricopeptide (TPR) repeat protein
MKRFGQQRVLAAIVAMLVIVGAAQETPPPQPSVTTHQDAPAPEPHPELKPLVEDIRTLLRDGKFQDALSKADDLLQEAKAKSDKIGEAYALRFRADALQAMRRTAPDQLPEVASVWASALALWREVGDVALQVEALLGQAYCLWRASPEQARALLQDALQLAKREGKRPLAAATALHNAGMDWYGVGQLGVAEQLFQQALAIYEKLAPNSLDVAQTLRNLAILARRQKNYSQAQRYLQRALKIYEPQRTAVQDPETKTAFAETYFNAYTLQAQLALDQQQPQQAALALERSRARTLAELMHTRDLTLPDNAPKALRDLIAQQEQLQRELLLLARQQRQTDPDDTNALQRLQAMSRELADRQRQLDRQLREQFPTYASLLNPQPPSLQEVQSALDPDTVLLYHAIANKELLIVAVSRQAVQGYRVKVDVRALERDLTEFQRLVAKPPLERTADERASVAQLGRRLYATLIKPAELSLKNAKTVLLCPEGALNRLPWGALVVSVDRQGRPTYWIERVAMGLTLSAGVYLQAEAVRPAPRGVAIAAVSQYRNPQGSQGASVVTLNSTCHLVQ